MALAYCFLQFLQVLVVDGVLKAPVDILEVKFFLEQP